MVPEGGGPMAPGRGKQHRMDVPERSWRSEKLRRSSPMEPQGRRARRHERRAKPGRLYLFGFGVPKDPVEARRLLNLAAAQGSSEAKAILEGRGQ